MKTIKLTDDWSGLARYVPADEGMELAARAAAVLGEASVCCEVPWPLGGFVQPHVLAGLAIPQDSRVRVTFSGAAIAATLAGEELESWSARDCRCKSGRQYVRAYMNDELTFDVLEPRHVARNDRVWLAVRD